MTPDDRPSDDLPVGELTALAERLADAARAETLPRFHGPRLSAANKAAKGFDPVTEADRGAEAAIRAILGRERPDDGIFGEEEAATPSRSGLTWVIDPVDGTRAFLAGLPTWGTLIALDDARRGRIGLVDLPATSERYLGIPGEGAWRERAGERAAISVRDAGGLARATLMTTDPELFHGPERAAYEEVRARVELTRLGTDCTAYALLALGRVDVVIEAGLHAYDIAAPKALIEAAGGIVTDWRGGDCRWGGQAVAAATRELHAEVLELLTPAAS